jgi:hypothetical protein
MMRSDDRFSRVVEEDQEEELDSSGEEAAAATPLPRVRVKRKFCVRYAEAPG